MAAHFVLQIGDGLPGPIPAAADIAEYPVGKATAAKPLGKQAVQRLIRDLGDGIPDRHLDQAAPVAELRQVAPRQRGIGRVGLDA